MKKTILALLTSAVFFNTAYAAVVYENTDQKVELTGRMEYDMGRLSSGQNNGGEGSARLGIKGRQATGYDNIALITWLEWQVSGEKDQTTDSKFDNRHAYAGFDFGNGIKSIFGHTDTPIKQLTDVTDLFDYWGVAAVNYPNNNKKVLLGMQRMNDMFMTTYQDSNLTLGGSFSSSDAEKENVTTTGTIPTSHYSGVAGYNFSDTGIKVITGYQQVEYKDVITEQSNIGKQYGIGVGYTHDAFYLGTNIHRYQSVDDINDNLYEMAGSYQINPRWKFIAGYAFVNDKATTNDDIREETAEFQFTFNPRTKAYVVYKNDNISTRDNTYCLGLQYNL